MAVRMRMVLTRPMVFEYGACFNCLFQKRDRRLSMIPSFPFLFEKLGIFHLTTNSGLNFQTFPVTTGSNF